MLNISLYELYHQKIKTQKRIITSKDFTYRNIISKIDKYIPSKGNVLDIGSATGTISFYLCSKGLNVDGVELSKKAVVFANLNKKILLLKNVNFINLAIEDYKSKKKYNLVTCFEVLEHLHDDKSCLLKVYNLMTKNSTFIISVPSVNAPLYKLDLLNTFDRKVGHLRRYSAGTIKRLLRKTGFDVIEEFKTEGLLRNMLFISKPLGAFIKLTKINILNDIVSNIDNLMVSIFGESQIILICKKDI